MGTLVPMVMILGVMWFLVLRPQQKRLADHKAMISNIRRGDTVVLSGGIIGRVVKAGEEAEISVEIAENTRVRVLKAQVSEVRAKGEPVKEKANDNS